MKDGKNNTTHAWKGVWNRPMKIDEDSLDPFTVARMTDHNVRGSDEEADDAVHAPRGSTMDDEVVEKSRDIPKPEAA